MLVERFRVNADVLFAGGFLFVVLLHPCGEAFSGGGVAPGEREGGDIAIGDGEFSRMVLGHHADEAIGERGAFDFAIEDVAVNFLAVFQRDGEVAAIVEGLLERFVNFRNGRERGNPSFEIFVDETETFFVGGFGCIGCVGDLTWLSGSS